MIPLNGFDTVLCRPSPTPTPSAPVNSAKVDRSTPIFASDSTTATLNIDSVGRPPPCRRKGNL
jgi:hypothetical protein